MGKKNKAGENKKEFRRKLIIAIIEFLGFALAFATQVLKSFFSE